VNLQFAKMHGLGNDFMVLDLISQPYQPKPEQIQAWSDRHTGIGFDQLLIVAPPENPDVDFRYRIFNADGTEAEQCGNGARCVAKLVADKGLCVRPSIRFQTSNGLIETHLLGNDQVEVDMGPPGLTPGAIPCDPAKAESEDSIGDARRFTLADDAGEQHQLTVASMGNPHGVILVDDITSARVDEIGARLTDHPFFPERANIGFCQAVDRGFIRLRVFERGVGETRACGTGACAAAVTSRMAGLVDEKVKVSLPGGKVRIRWQGPEHAVKMTGPATLVYEGQIAVEDA
jgi:diaminopimelate epimerase